MQFIGSRSVNRFAEGEVADPRRFAARLRLNRGTHSFMESMPHSRFSRGGRSAMSGFQSSAPPSERESLVPNTIRLFAIAGVMALVGACSSPPPPPPAPMVPAPAPPPVAEQPYTVPPAPPPRHYAHHRYHRHYVHHVYHHHVYHHHVVHHVTSPPPASGGTMAPAPMAPAPMPPKQ